MIIPLIPLFSQALVHVSTAYGNCHLPEVYEELYPAPIDPGRLIQLTEWLDDKLLEDITPRLVEPRPNTYTFTKALAEHLLVNDGEGLPITIIRPSIGTSRPLSLSGSLGGGGGGGGRRCFVSPPPDSLVFFY